MRSILSIDSTLDQGLILVLGAFLILSYSFSLLRQGVQDWKNDSPTNRATNFVFNLGLLRLYGLFAYFWVAEEMSDRGFRALARILGGRHLNRHFLVDSPAQPCS